MLTGAKSSLITWCWNEKIALNVSLDISMVPLWYFFKVYALIRKHFHCNLVFLSHSSIFLFSCQFAILCRPDEEASVDQAYSCCCSPVLLFCCSFFVILMQSFVFLFTTFHLLTDIQCHNCKAVPRHCWLNFFEGQWRRESL